VQVEEAVVVLARGLYLLFQESIQDKKHTLRTFTQDGKAKKELQDKIERFGNYKKELNELATKMKARIEGEKKEEPKKEEEKKGES
jgi:uncharacterized protein YydD (DUF2326 family)